MRKTIAILLLSCLCIAKAVAATYKLGQELTWDAVKGGGVAFALVSGDEILYGTTNQELAFGSASNALLSTNTAFTWKVESDTNGFLFHAYTPTGSSYSIWGGSWLNAQPNVGGVTFILGKSGSDKTTGESWTGGQDMANGAIWEVTTVSGGYTIQNVGNKGYLAGTTTSTTAEKTWKFYKVAEVAADDIYGDNTGSDSGLRAIRRYGNNLVYYDDVSTAVVLHGVMDTPNAYFQAGRWTNGVTWADYNNTSSITPCLNYFTQIFNAINNPDKGTYCNLFRLHLDPCWLKGTDLANGFTDTDGTITDPHGSTVSGEASVAYFSKTKFEARLQDLYIPIIKDAIAHGLYVIVRPPGVFPQNVVVGDYYNEYLKTIWDIVSSDSYIKAHQGQISLELGNEPVHIWEAGTTDFTQNYYLYDSSRTNMYDFFQPIVTKIRENGFNGIIWAPGTGYQAEYRGYSKKMLSDPDDNFGFAAHFYPGWYSTTSNDATCASTDAAVLSTFKTQIPVQANYPIVITEVDWSPKDGVSGHYDEHGDWVVSNYGTWGTGSTSLNSRFGEQYKYVVDQCGNVSWTIEGADLYVDMDAYLEDGTIQPSFLDKANINDVDIYEACSGAAFKWFREYAGGTTAWVEEDNCLKVTNTEARTNVWDWQIRYPLPTTLTEETKYTIEIVAKAANATNIGVWPVVSTEDNVLQYAGIDVTTEWSTQSIVTNGSHAYDYLYFNIGKVDGDFMISNIKITDNSTGTVVYNNVMNDNSTWTKTQSELTLSTVDVSTEASTVPVSLEDEVVEDNYVASTYGRRPIDNKHPMWLVHVDVWNQADPQKIIDLIPEDIKPYVVMNLSLSCSYDKANDIYMRPQDAVKTYKSWASVCQQNGMWFTCQPASGGHTHIMDDDLETFEYFFKTYPNFLGWNYAEQFWGFGESGDKSSTTEESRLALFAKLIPMHAKYGGFLTISFCGNQYSHALNPVGMLKRNADLLQASKDNPDAILWLYKYTHPVCFYNNESVTFGPFVAGLAKNYGVRYDNCGYNDALNSLKGEDSGIQYPTAAGIGTVMEQMCQNGGAVWDGPELIWTEDFQNLATTKVDGYTQRNWGTYPGFRNIWIDMFRKVIDGTMYIPTQKEVQEKTKIAIINDVTSGSDQDKYATWNDLYDNLYMVDDPLNATIDSNYGKGQMQNNFSYQKSTGRYGTIPMVPELYTDDAKAIATQVNKSTYSTTWTDAAAKKAAFDAAYPEVSTGDLFVSRYKNQLVTYNPYSNLGKTSTDSRSASANVPFKYNTCESMDLTWANYSSAIVKEHRDHIDFYLNNYRSDTTTTVIDKIVINGASAQPSYSMTARAEAVAYATESWADNVYTLEVSHMGPVDLTINCSGAATSRSSKIVCETALDTDLPKQPDTFVGKIVKEAEDMNYKNVASCIDNYYYQDISIRGHAGNGIMKMGSNTAGGLTTNVKTNSTGSYNVTVRYSNTDKTGNVDLSVGSTTKELALETTETNEWKKATATFSFTEGNNTFKLDNTEGIAMWVDQVEFTPAEIAEEEYDIVLGTAENGSVTATKTSATEGTKVTLVVTPDKGYALDGWNMGFTKVTLTENSNGTYSFTMPDNAVTITPVFKDVTTVYQLDIASTVNSSIPEGWRTTDGTDVHEYPGSYGSGPRIFSSFIGTYTSALYWRHMGSGYASADYGKLDDYPLTLKAGNYKLSYRMAAWKETPTFQAQILNSSGTVVKTTDDITTTLSAGGSSSADLSSVEEQTLEFTVSETGNYVINFESATGGEFLLIDCRINDLDYESQDEETPTEDNDLTADMFYNWTAADATGTKNGKAGCAYVRNESTDMPYGDGNVYYLNYADLSDYGLLVVTAISGAPRFLFNRDVDNGQDPDHLINIPNNADQTSAYEMVTEGDNAETMYTINLAKIKADKGYVHLHAIKGANFGNTIVTSMKLYSAGDVDGDGNVNLEDLTHLIEIVEGNEARNGREFIDDSPTLSKDDVPAMVKILMKK